jgi:transcriptional regulator with XRE-family HTH domain
LSFGNRLRQQRERNRVSLTAIAGDTKISVALLEGLERDDVSRWPGGLFRRAYVRAYARAVGLEPEAVVREFVQLYPDPIEEALAQGVAQTRNGEQRPHSRLGILRAGLAIFQAEQVEAPVPNPITPKDAMPAWTEPPALERDLRSVATLCTALGRAQDQEAVSGVLQDAGRILGARGVILWVWDAVRAALCPAIAHGYPEQVVQQLARLARSTDSAIAAAFRTAQPRVVDGGGRRATGAFVTPLLTPAGCVGVLAMEFGDGGEQRESTRAFATILGAQLSTLLPASLLAVTGTAESSEPDVPDSPAMDDCIAHVQYR